MTTTFKVMLNVKEARMSPNLGLVIEQNFSKSVRGTGVWSAACLLLVHDE